MLKLIEDWWEFGLHALATMPASLAAFLIGWSFSIATTQPVKFMLPLLWHADDRELITRVVAMLSAMIPAGLYYAQAKGANPSLLWLVMVGTGLWSPIAFALLIAWLRRGGKESFVADVLTGDKRGVIVSKLRGRP